MVRPLAFALASLLAFLAAPAAWAGGDEDFRQACRRAWKAKKGVVVFFHDPDSATSRGFGGVLAGPGVRELLEAKFEPVLVERASGHPLIARFGVRRWPTLWFCSARGQPLKGITGSVGAAVLRRQIGEVARKLRPPKRRVIKKPPQPKGARPKAPRLRHGRACPRGCQTCTAALARSVTWLLKRQDREGCWRKPRPPGPRATSLDFTSVALTSLGGLALISAGRPLDDPALLRARAWLLKTIRRDGIVSPHSDELVYQTYTWFQTPLAALFLVECLGSADDAKLRLALARIAAAIVRGQGPKGGWGYGLSWKIQDPTGAMGWTTNATSSLCLLTLARLAQAGVAVDDKALALGWRYLTWLRAGGGFGYGSQNRFQSHPGADAMVALAGSHLLTTPDAALARARSAVRRSFARVGSVYLAKTQQTFGKFELWGRVWCAWALTRAGGALAWHAFARDRVLAEQRPDGGWPDPLQRAGPRYATAMAILTLSAGAQRLSFLHTAPRPPGAKGGTPLASQRSGSRARLLALPAGGYRVELRVACAEKVGPAYVKALSVGLQQASDRLFDATEGQLHLGRAEIGGPATLSAAHLRFVVTERPLAHGETHSRREVSGGRMGPRLRTHVECPLELPGHPRATGGGWSTRGGGGILAHELGHFLLGLPDEYDLTTLRRLCPPCLMQGGPPFSSELCRESDHGDPRHPACWTTARKHLPALAVPRRPAPGPWLAPKLEIVTR
jgi:hypothetical protein